MQDGASLIYTAPYLSNYLQGLIHSSLGIHSLLKRQSFKPNIIDRDKILVPSNWDSWGKIRILTEGFDLEGMSTAWSIEIQDPPEPLSNTGTVDDGDGSSSAVTMYEQTIRDPRRDFTISSTPSGQDGGQQKLDVETSSMQTFLAEQQRNLEQLRIENESERRENGIGPKSEMTPSDNAGGRVNEHIGPVQFNMGGIQVDADDMLKKLKVGECRDLRVQKLKVLLLTLYRRVKRRAEPRNGRRQHHLPAMRRHTISSWPTSLLVWFANRALMVLLVGVLRHSFWTRSFPCTDQLYIDYLSFFLSRYRS